MQYGGNFEKWKDRLEKHLRKPCVFRHYVCGGGDDGAGDVALQYRKTVLDCFCSDGSGMRSSSSYALYTYARKRLLNGRYHQVNVVEHFCAGCCTSAEDSIRQRDLRHRLHPHAWCEQIIFVDE